jgi:hypothetical protein
MGYYSQVAYKIKFEEKNRFVGFVTEAKLDPRTQKCFEDEGLEVNEDENEVRFIMRSGKWYSDYEGVQCHEALLLKVDTYIELADEANEEHPCWYAFARVGEETDDNEERYGGDDVEYGAVCINRSVEVDWQ